jgi:hypothetical protein
VFSATIEAMTSDTPAHATNRVHPRRTLDPPAKAPFGSDRTTDSVIAFTPLVDTTKRD